MGEPRACSGCGATLDSREEGVELWGTLFCSNCFISHSAKLHKELTEDDVKILRALATELAGFLPPELVEMVLVGFYRRSGGDSEIPAEELSRAVGEIQRLAALATFRRVLNLLRTWKDSFDEFIESQEADIRERVRKLTDKT